MRAEVWGRFGKQQACCEAPACSSSTEATRNQQQRALACRGDVLSRGRDLPHGWHQLVHHALRSKRP